MYFKVQVFRGLSIWQYLVILAIGVFAATRRVGDTFAGTQDVAGITHTGLGARSAAGGGSACTRVLTGVRTGLVMAVGRATKSCAEGEMAQVRSVSFESMKICTHSERRRQSPT